MGRAKVSATFGTLKSETNDKVGLRQHTCVHSLLAGSIKYEEARSYVCPLWLGLGGRSSAYRMTLYVEPIYMRSAGSLASHGENLLRARYTFVCVSVRKISRLFTAVRGVREQKGMVREPKVGKLLAVAGFGGSLEFFDFVLFIFFTPIISRTFFPPEMPEWIAIVQTLGIFSAGYIFRPMGGLIMAHYGDLIGRKRVFTFSILLMAVATAAIAILPGYDTIGWLGPLALVGLRIVQGIAIGGEVPGAWTFISEHVRSKELGLACSFLCSCLAFGVFLASFVSLLTNTLFTPEELRAYGWRIPFVLGGALGLLGVFVRRWLTETPVFLLARERRSLASRPPIIIVLKSHVRGITVSVAATWILSAGIIVATMMTPTLLEKRYGIDAFTSLAVTCFGSIFMMIGGIISGILVDRIGMGKFYILASPFYAAATYLFYMDTGTSNIELYIRYAMLSLVNGVIGVAPCFMVRSFPSNVRFTGISFAYNITFAVIGGASPVMIAALLPTMPFVHAYYMQVVAMGMFFLGAYAVVGARHFSGLGGVDEIGLDGTATSRSIV